MQWGNGAFVPVVSSISNLALIANGIGTTSFEGRTPPDDDELAPNFKAELGLLALGAYRYSASTKCPSGGTKDIDFSLVHRCSLAACVSVKLDGS